MPAMNAQLVRIALLMSQATHNKQKVDRRRVLFPRVLATPIGGINPEFLHRPNQAERGK